MRSLALFLIFIVLILWIRSTDVLNKNKRKIESLKAVETEWEQPGSCCDKPKK